MNKRYLMMMCFVLSMCFSAHSTQIPKAGLLDSRVKSVIYHPKQVTKIVGHYGYATHIQLSPSEIVQNIAMGDSEAWEVAPKDNHIFLKPKGKKASTNMAVISNKRIYHFDLEAKYTSGSRYAHSKMYYQINFMYPEELAQQQQTQEAAEQLRYALDDDALYAPLNWHYFSKGSENIKPIKVFDDGRFTYLTFAQNTDMPAIYTLDADDQESLVNTHINPKSPQTIILQKITQRMVLRKGNAVLLIVNKSYPSKDTFYKADTTLPMVNRVIKGGHHAR